MSESLNSSEGSSEVTLVLNSLSSALSINVYIKNVRKPTHSKASPQKTELETPPFSAKTGLSWKTANTPRRARAISKPIARAISLPLNHFTMVFETVIPAISTPTPKIAKPTNANLAEAGIDGAKLPNQLAKPVTAKASVNAKNFNAPPITIVNPAVIIVKRIPILSSMIPERIRKPAKTFRKNSEPPSIPNTSGVHL